MLNFAYGIGVCFAVMMCSFFAAIIFLSNKGLDNEEDEFEGVDSRLDTALSFLVLCHLQPDHVDHDELALFLQENGALENN